MYRNPILMAGLGALAFTAATNAAQIDWSKVDQAIGKPGSDQPAGVHKYGLPRSHGLRAALDLANVRHGS
jgi:hypothetical protein